jgi:hypothetical protein
MRPVIILYTDAAEISSEVLAAMPAAGYLPVKVADANAIRVLDIPVGAHVAEMDLITQAALYAIKQHLSSGGVQQTFGNKLATMLTKAATP